MDTITNGDAVSDCLIYALQCRLDEKEPIPGTRRIIDGPPNERDTCSITMCGNDDEPGIRMLRICENGHCMHDCCFENYLMNVENIITQGDCPQCRSSHMWTSVEYYAIMFNNALSDRVSPRAVMGRIFQK